MGGLSHPAEPALCTVPLTCKVALTCSRKLAREKRGMVPVLLASIHCVSHRLKTGKQNRWNANLIGTYFITNKVASATLKVSSTVTAVTYHRLEIYKLELTEI